MINQVLTSAGAALLREAVNDSKKIVFTRAIAGSHYDMDSRGDLSAKPIDWYDGDSGDVVSVSSSLGDLQIFVGFGASLDGDVPVKSVCVCAQIASDDVDPEYDPSDDVVFCAACDDNSGFTSGTAFAVQFNLPISIPSLVDDVGVMPNAAGLNVVSFTAGEGGADGILVVKLANGTSIDIAANPSA